MTIRVLDDKEKLMVFKKLAKWISQQQNKDDTDIVVIMTQCFSQSALYHIFGSKAVKSTNMNQQVNFDQGILSRSRASSVQSIDIEIQTDISQVETTGTQTSPKRQNDSPAKKSKKPKLDKIEAAKEFLNDFALVERPDVNHFPIDEQELERAERCDDKDRLVEYIKTNLAKLNSSKLHVIQIRLVIARQFKTNCPFY